MLSLFCIVETCGWSKKKVKHYISRIIKALWPGEFYWKKDTPRIYNVVIVAFPTYKICIFLIFIILKWMVLMVDGPVRKNEG